MATPSFIANPKSPPLTSTGFLVGVPSGSYVFTFDLTGSPGDDPAFITRSGGTVSNALKALIAGFAEGRVYLDIRTTSSPNGEIRGFLSEVPEPPPRLQLAAKPAVSGLVARSAVGPAETSSVLQTSADLATWADVETIFFTGLPQSVSYQSTPNEPRRYFRLRLP